MGLQCKALLLLNLGLLFLLQAGGICWSQTTERVSVNSFDADSNGASNLPSISSDGRYVAFQSGATDLVAGDLLGFIDIFVRDRLAETTIRVSLHTDGTEGEGPSSDPSISTNGRYVAFESEAGNLVAGDTVFPLGFPDIFVHDLQTGTTTWVSEDSLGGEGDGPSLNPSISGDGRYVAFESSATNLVAGDGNGFIDIFVHDRDADGDGIYDDEDGTYDPGEVSTVRVSVDLDGNEADGNSYAPSISSEGRYVTFYSEADNFVANDSNGTADVFVHDRDADENGTYDEVGGVSTVRVSVDSSRNQGNGNSSAPAISANGQSVAFESDADNLVAGDGNGFFDIFVYGQEYLLPTPSRSEENHTGSGPCFLATAASDWVSF